MVAESQALNAMPAAWLQSTIVHWSGFSSTSLDPATARSFAAAFSSRASLARRTGTARTAPTPVARPPPRRRLDAATATRKRRTRAEFPSFAFGDGGDAPRRRTCRMTTSTWTTCCEAYHGVRMESFGECVYIYDISRVFRDTMVHIKSTFVSRRAFRESFPLGSRLVARRFFRPVQK